MKWDHLCGLVDAEPIVDLGSWGQIDNLNSHSYRPSLLLGSCDCFPPELRANGSNGLEGLLPSYPQTPSSSASSQPSSTPGPLYCCSLCFWASHKCSPGSLLPGLHSSGSTVFLKVPSANTLAPFSFLCVINAGRCMDLPLLLQGCCHGAGLSNSHRV